MTIIGVGSERLIRFIQQIGSLIKRIEEFETSPALSDDRMVFDHAPGGKPDQQTLGHRHIGSRRKILHFRDSIYNGSAVCALRSLLGQQATQTTRINRTIRP